MCFYRCATFHLHQANNKTNYLGFGGCIVSLLITCLDWAAPIGCPRQMWLWLCIIGADSVRSQKKMHSTTRNLTPKAKLPAQLAVEMRDLGTLVVNHTQWALSR